MDGGDADARVRGRVVNKVISGQLKTNVGMFFFGEDPQLCLEVYKYE